MSSCQKDAAEGLREDSLLGSDLEEEAMYFYTVRICGQ